jgi:hypothetical protein
LIRKYRQQRFGHKSAFYTKNARPITGRGFQSNGNSVLDIRARGGEAFPFILALEVAFLFRYYIFISNFKRRNEGEGFFYETSR